MAYRNPYPTVDVVVEIDGGILLIERSNEPLGWALPGGFIDYGEDPEDAARREVEEETGLRVRLTQLLGVYGAPDRDPRQHNLSIVYIGHAEGTPRAADDAQEAKAFPLDSLPDVLCFDHNQIISDYKRLRNTGLLPKPRIRYALTYHQRKYLLQHARESLLSSTSSTASVSSVPHSASDHSALQRHAACFVTLRKSDGSLRGCIGTLQATEPLRDAIARAARNAALHDPRFEAVTAAEAHELRIGISVLSPMRSLASPEALVVGTHGLVVEYEGRRGVLLPEVAGEQGWTREQFLDATCQKANLPPRIWQDPRAHLQIFESEKFGDSNNS